MALGKAIVSTSLGAQGIEVENGKHLIIANNASEFTNAISKIVSDPQLAIDLGNNARKLIEEKYDNKKVIERLLAFYSEQKKINY